MRTSQAGIDHIKQFERLRLSAYNTDGAGVWTIGYGHTGLVDGKPIRRGMTITEAKAVELLREDLAEAEQAVNSGVKVPLTQNQFDALVSFAFNVGAGAFRSSSVLKYVNRRRYAEVPARFMLWVKARDPATGQLRTLRGLINRRRAEAELWRGMQDDRSTAGAETTIAEGPPVEAPQTPSAGEVVAPVATGTGGGLLVLLEAFPALRDAVKRALDSVGAGDALIPVLGASIAAGAAVILFRRWRSAGYPLPWRSNAA